MIETKTLVIEYNETEKSFDIKLGNTLFMQTKGENYTEHLAEAMDVLENAGKAGHTVLFK